MALGAPHWRTRGYLPHFEAPLDAQHIVFRLADSLPQRIEADIAAAPRWAWLDAAESALDAGHGGRHLAAPDIADLVARALEYGDGARYALHAWCVMPTHVHVLVQPASGWSLGRLVHGWKSFTAHAANRRIGRTGPFWAREYFDRVMRDERQFELTSAYIERNPVTAGLCADAAAWRWSSAAEKALRGL